MFDERRMNSSTNFMDALLWACASFFVSNRYYPQEYACTLEFLQRYAVGLHPESGSKSSSGSRIIVRVTTLYKKLTKYCHRTVNEELDAIN